MTRHILIGCSQTKAKVAQCVAISMYKGELFSLSVRYANLVGGRRWILSALHGLLRDFECIKPYDETLNSVAKRKAWTERVTDQLHKATRKGDELVVLAGANYCGFALALIASGRTVTQPLLGMQIGQRKQWLGAEVERLIVERTTAPKETT